MCTPIHKHRHTDIYITVIYIYIYIFATIIFKQYRQWAFANIDVNRNNILKQYLEYHENYLIILTYSILIDQ